MQLTIPSALAWFAFAQRILKPCVPTLLLAILSTLKSFNLRAEPTPLAGENIELHQSARETSGALLGCIGAGFVELRPDGCFYEWAIMNRNPWGYIRADWTKDKFERQPLPYLNADSLRFFIHTVDPDGDPHVRRLNVRGEQTNVYSPDSSIFNVEAIDHEAVFPRATLRFRDPSLPVQVSICLSITAEHPSWIAMDFAEFLTGRGLSASPG
ncbi:MAG: GH116 family glycosyl-hydrolase [Chthoniobacteraceae bacterium]